MRILLLLFLMFVATRISYTQTLLVPYRVGHLFGLADTNGIIKVKPEFNSLSTFKMPKYAFTFSKVIRSFTQKYKQGGERTIAKKTCGIIDKGKKIIETDLCDEFDYLSNAFIIGHARQGFLRENTKGIFTDSGVLYKLKDKEEYEYYDTRWDCKFLFNMKGENLFPDGVRRIIPVDMIGDKSKDLYEYVLFVVQDFEERASLVEFDVKKAMFKQWLLKDKFNISQASDHSHRGMLAVWENSKYDTPTYYQVVHGDNGFELKAQLPVQSPNTNYHDEMVMEPPVEVMESYGMIGEPPMPVEDVKKSPVYINISHTISKETTTYTFSQTMQNSASSKIYSKQHDNIDTAVVMRFYNRFTSPGKDSIFALESTIFYKSNHKYGFMSSDTNHMILYDSILIFKNSSCHNLSPIMMVMRSSNGRNKFGLIDILHHVLLPVDYDSIVFQKDNYKQQRTEGILKSYDLKTATVLAYKNNHASIFTNFDSLVTSTTYDSITYNQNFGSFTTEAFILKKGKVYDLLLEYGSQVKYYVLHLPYKPSFMQSSFNRFDNFDLIGLDDEKGNFLCYATMGGKVLYREKE